MFRTRRVELGREVAVHRFRSFSTAYKDARWWCESWLRSAPHYSAELTPNCCTVLDDRHRAVMTITIVDEADDPPGFVPGEHFSMPIPEGE